MNIKEVKEEIKKIKENIELEFDEKESKISKLIQNYGGSQKEYLYIYSKFGKCYSVNKESRDFLINNIILCLDNNELNFDEKNQLMMAYIDAEYKNYNYDNAEKMCIKLVKNNLEDYIIFYQLAEYYIVTRRYEQSLKYLNCATEYCDDDVFRTLILKKIDECNIRKRGKEYLPATQENRIKYATFMNKLGKEIILPKTRAKAPKKILKEEYPKPVELMNSNFNTFVAFDVETTGIDHSKDSITELAAIRVVNGIIDESDKFIFQELIHPYKRKIPKNVERITGITNEMVTDCREIWEVFNDFADWLGDDILLGYNCMTFDSKFLVRAGRLSNRVIDNKYFDVMKYAKDFKVILNSDDMKLTSVGLSLNIQNPQAHRALADAITTAKVFLKLQEMEKNFKL